MGERFFKSFSLSFASGCLGGLVSSFIIWLCVHTELTTHFKVKITPPPSLSGEWLYPKIIWGGIWGFLFLLPILKRSYFFRGIFYSLIPCLIQLLIVLPFIDKQGFMGTNKGDLMPAFILSFHLAWGISAALWLQYIEK